MKAAKNRSTAGYASRCVLEIRACLRSSILRALTPKLSQEFLLRTTRRGRGEDLRFLLTNGEMSANHRGEAVVYAASNGDEPSLSLLLDHGPISPLHRTAAVCLAVRAGHYKSALLLFKDCCRGLTNTALIVGLIAVGAFAAIQYTALADRG